MKKNKIQQFIIIFLFLGIVPTLFAQDNNEKLAQTGFQFLSVGTNARAAGMGEAFTTFEGSSEALFYNPAGMAKMGSLLNINFNQMTWIADIKYYSASLALSIEDGKYGVVGLSFFSIDYGKFLWTRVAPELPSGYEDIGQNWSAPTSFMIGLGYAKQLSDKFSVGGQVKYVKQNLGTSNVPVFDSDNKLVGSQEQSYAQGVIAFDFGTRYRTGFKSLVFGMSVRNFARNLRYEKESFQLPLVFKIGISFNLIDFVPELSDNHALYLSVDASHPRSHPEFISVGTEYLFMNMIALRAGYTTGQDNYNFTAGFGVRKFGFAFDYSYTPFDIFNNVHRFSVGFSF